MKMMQQLAVSSQSSALKAGFKFTGFLVVADSCALIADGSEAAHIAG